jgi:CPA1 family monovalent cation:H+ antiporter
MSFNAVVRSRDRLVGFHPPRPMLRPTVGSGLVLSWSGMRGIVSLAAAIALPAAFPYRGFIVLTAFAVVLGTLVVQGLTLKPLLRLLDLHDDDPVGHEVQAARARALEAALAILAADGSPVANVVRQELSLQMTRVDVTIGAATGDPASHGELRRRSLEGARQAVHAMRRADEIGDDAFHQLEEELDWLEMAGNPTTE